MSNSVSKRSDSSCTYKDLISEYGRTKDKSMWTPVSVKDSDVCSLYEVDEIPVCLVDKEAVEPVKEIPVLNSEAMEEMVMEPILFDNPDISKIFSYWGYEGQSTIVMSASTYGIKNIIFGLEDCLLCTGDGISCIAVSNRLVRKVVRDCREKEIDCTFGRGKPAHVYRVVPLPDSLLRQSENVRGVSKEILIKPMVTPLFEQKYTKSYKAIVVVAMCLVPGEYSFSMNSLGEVIENKGQREIQVIPVAIRAQF